MTPYPDPTPPEIVARMVDDMVAKQIILAEQRDLWIGRYRLKLRLRRWLEESGVAPTREARTAYAEQKHTDAYKRISDECANKGKSEA